MTDTELIPRKKWRAREMGRYLIVRPTDPLDIYCGAQTLESARKRKREVSHWPDVTIYDQATDSFLGGAR